MLDRNNLKFLPDEVIRISKAILPWHAFRELPCDPPWNSLENAYGKSIEIVSEGIEGSTPNYRKTPCR